MADSLSDARAFQERVDGFDKRLRRAGYADIADLLRDLLAEHARLRHRATAAQHRASAEYDQRIDVQARLDLFKHQLSVQEALTGSRHHAYDAILADRDEAEQARDAASATVDRMTKLCEENGMVLDTLQDRDKRAVAAVLAAVELLQQRAAERDALHAQLVELIDCVCDWIAEGLIVSDGMLSSIRASAPPAAPET